MIIELVGFIMAFAYKSKVTEVYEKTLSEAFNKGLETNDTKFMTAFQDLENNMECCGVYGLSDYNNSTYTQRSTWCKAHPESKGCSTAIINFLNKNLPAIGITLGVVLAIELLGLIASIALAVALKHAPTERYSSNPRTVIQDMRQRRANYN